MHLIELNVFPWHLLAGFVDTLYEPSWCWFVLLRICLALAITGPLQLMPCAISEHFFPRKKLTPSATGANTGEHCVWSSVSFGKGMLTKIQPKTR